MSPAAVLTTISNAEIGAALQRVARLLEAQGANMFRVRAYDDAARTVRDLEESAWEIVQSRGRDGLEELPGIGTSLSAAIEELVRTGRLARLERLMGAATPEALFTTVPGIGPELAHRIADELGIDTLEDLELAAWDGRLQSVDGFGLRRVRGVREALGSMLARRSRRPPQVARDEPESRPTSAPAPVATLLEVDARYRRLAAEGKLRSIAPRRFNPKGAAWLPVLHLDHDGWTFTAMFSNTAQAHALGKTRDWVVIFCERDGDEHQCTVVTQTRGALTGKRVVRGREAECAAQYLV